ncbi:MAG: DUF4281 domain-containing protein [Novosphingobium sp.]|nr:DUF4281 domain-containing protein [Novosphingobium sp.]
MWSALFFAANGIALAGWVLLTAFPRKPLTHSAILYLGVSLLCLIYTVCFALVVGGGWGGGLSPEASGFSIAGVRAFFATDGGAFIGWTHYLAFDLFTGLWIARDADSKDVSRLVQLPFLILTFLVGPIGLFFWLVVRERKARASGRG